MARPIFARAPSKEGEREGGREHTMSGSSKTEAETV